MNLKTLRDINMLIAIVKKPVPCHLDTGIKTRDAGGGGTTACFRGDVVFSMHPDPMNAARDHISVDHDVGGISGPISSENGDPFLVSVAHPFGRNLISPDR